MTRPHRMPCLSEPRHHLNRCISSIFPPIHLSFWIPLFCDAKAVKWIHPYLWAPILMFLLSAGSAQVWGSEIRFVSGTIDTATAPQIDSHSLRTQMGSQGKGLILVQFRGPIQPEWRAQAEKAGATFHNYIPNYAYYVTIVPENLSALKSIKSVAWVGTAPSALKIHPTLQRHRRLSPDTELDVTILSVEKLPHQILNADGIQVKSSRRSQIGWYDTRATVSPAFLEALSEIWCVFHVEPQPNYRLYGERAAQTAAGNLTLSGTHPIGTGYKAWLESHGLTGGEGLVAQVMDDGVDQGDASGNPGTAHPDLLGRIAGIFNATSDATGGGIGGHGHLNAAVIVGTAQVGTRDAGGFLLGQGLAPASKVYGTKIFRDAGPFDLGGHSFQFLVADAQNAGCQFSNNSWGTDNNGGYDADSAVFDALIRDSDPFEIGNQPMICFFAAGNQGPQNGTIGSPATAKNAIAIGATENSDADGTDGCGSGPSDADNARDLARFSARGPTADGRLGITVVAVGSHVQGAIPTHPGYDGSQVCDKFWPPGQTDYLRSSGTSHSCPVACGAGMIVYEFFQRHLSRGLDPHTANPSPALIKAALANTARDNRGASNGAGELLQPIPNPDQGWGSVDLSNLIEMKDGLVSFDQDHIFTASGQVWERKITPLDPQKPLKITLVWTDSPANPSASPVQVNDLDLVVIGPEGTFLGNVFSAGFSSLGGTSDRLNNIESVYIQNPSLQSYAIRVQSFNIAGDGVPGVGGSLDQDFALFIWNGVEQSSQGTVQLNKTKFQCSDTLQVKISDLDLRGVGTTTATLLVVRTGDVEPLTLEETRINSGVFLQSIPTTLGDSAVTSDGLLQVVSGDTITVTYQDEDNGSGVSVAVVSTAQVDCEPPVGSEIALQTPRSNITIITFETNEPANAHVRLGLSCDQLTQETETDTFEQQHEIIIQDLAPNTRYFYAIDLVDEAGNTTTLRENNGDCFTFETPELSDDLTEVFNGAFDLRGRTLRFLPDGSQNTYSVCSEPASAFPTDPTGPERNELNLSDDSFIGGNLTGFSVPFFGANYTSFFVGSNGYITFGEGDFEPAPDLSNHFAIPRISGHYLDLNPEMGGAISAMFLADRIAITYEDVPEFFSPFTNHFQIEMFFNGEIAITHLNLPFGSVDGLVGLSAGRGVPFGFISSDFSESSLCDDVSSPTPSPTASPTLSPTVSPTTTPTLTATASPTLSPTVSPTTTPTLTATASPTLSPTVSPTTTPTLTATASPTLSPTASPTTTPTLTATASPTLSPTVSPTTTPTLTATASPTLSPTASPTTTPTLTATASLTLSPTVSPTTTPTLTATASPTLSPTASLTTTPTLTRTMTPAPTSASGLDSDQDGLSDAYEITHGSDPNDSNSFPEALDFNNDDSFNLADGIALYRNRIGASPPEADNDHDGFSDAYENRAGSDPNSAIDFPAAIDLNGDEKVGILDAILIYRNRVGMIPVISRP